MRKLKIQEQKFADEYIISENAYRSALKAGYKEGTAKNAYEWLSETLRTPTAKRKLPYKKYLVDYIYEVQKEDQKKYRDKFEITKDDIIKEYASIGFNDITELVSTDGRKVIIKSTDELTPQQRKSISGIKQGRNGIEVTFYDKTKALDSLCRILGFNEDKVQLSGGLDVKNPFQDLTTEELKKLIKK